MTPREFGFIVKVALDENSLSAFEKEALTGLGSGLARVGRMGQVHARRAARFAASNAARLGRTAAGAGAAAGSAAGSAAGHIAGGASHLGSRLGQAISDAATAGSNMSNRFINKVLVPGVLRGGELTKDMLYSGGRLAGNVAGPALAGLGGVGMYGAGLGSQYVLSPAVRAIGHLLTNVAGGSATLAGRGLRGAAFSKNPLARTAQTLTGAGIAGGGGLAAYKSMSDK